jgi:succinate-semialdehyde dehydrogenase/glutarate-semialdehyde dehydrogenase
MENRYIKSINPYNGELLTEYLELSDSQIDESIDVSNRAFNSWKRSDIIERSTLLQRCNEVLINRKEELATIITSEMGKIYAESISEIEKCAWVCRYYAENGEIFLKDEPLDAEGNEAFISYSPLGVVLAVMPWNFPFWQVFRFAAPAVMAGNAGLLKHASNVPQCALAIEEVFREAGAQDGLFKTLMIGAGKVNQIIDDWRVKAVTLTGSELAGSLVAERAGKNIKKTVLELGGSDPFIVLADADIDLASKTAVKARMLNCGQSCIAAKRFIVHSTVHKEFLKKFAKELKELVMGDPMDSQTDYGPMAREDLANDLQKQVDSSIAAGASLIDGSMTGKEEGAFFKAGLLQGVRPGMPAYEEEIFGPVASLIEAKDDREIIDIANSSKYGLGASVWTQDRDRGIQVARQIESGSVFINKMVASHPSIPFGGIKMSGYGRELSHLGIREFLNAKPIVY